MKRKLLCALVSVSLLFMSIKIPAQAAAVTKTATGVTSNGVYALHHSNKEEHPAKTWNCTAVYSNSYYIPSTCPKCGGSWNDSFGGGLDMVCCPDSIICSEPFLECQYSDYKYIMTCDLCHDTSASYTIPAHTATWCTTCNATNVGCTEYWQCSGHYEYVTNGTYTTNSIPTPMTSNSSRCQHYEYGERCSVSYFGYGHTYTNFSGCTESAPYTNAAYGYINGSSKTFKVYPVNISYQDVDGTTVTAAQAGVTITASSPKQTANDYFLPGNTVKLAVSGSVTSIKMNSAVLVYNQSNGYSFTMPTADANVVVTVDLNPVKVSPTVSSASISVGQTATITANATEGSTVTYSSSDATGLLVSSTGVVTGKKKGTYTVTVTATK